MVIVSGKCENIYRTHRAELKEFILAMAPQAYPSLFLSKKRLRRLVLRVLIYRLFNAHVLVTIIGTIQFSSNRMRHRLPRLRANKDAVYTEIYPITILGTSILERRRPYRRSFRNRHLRPSTLENPLNVYQPHQTRTLSVFGKGNWGN